MRAVQKERAIKQIREILWDWYDVKGISAANEIWDTVIEPLLPPEDHRSVELRVVTASDGYKAIVMDPGTNECICPDMTCRQHGVGSQS